MHPSTTTLWLFTHAVISEATSVQIFAHLIFFRFYFSDFPINKQSEHTAANKGFVKYSSHTESKKHKVNNTHTDKYCTLHFTALLTVLLHAANP